MNAVGFRGLRKYHKGIANGWFRAWPLKRCVAHQSFLQVNSRKFRPMLSTVSEATDDELWHIQHGSVDRISPRDKLRLTDPGEWLRIKLDVRSVVVKMRGGMFARSKAQAGEHFMMIFLRTMSATCDTQLSHVFACVSDHLRLKYDIEVQPSFLSVHLPRHVPVSPQYALVD